MGETKVAKRLTNDRVQVTGQEGRLETSMQGVDDDAQRNEETGGIQVHPRQSIHHSRSPEQKHGRDDDVGRETET